MTSFLNLILELHQTTESPPKTLSLMSSAHLVSDIFRAYYVVDWVVKNFCQMM